MNTRTRDLNKEEKEYIIVLYKEGYLPKEISKLKNLNYYKVLETLREYYNMDKTNQEEVVK